MLLKPNDQANISNLVYSEKIQHFFY